MKKLNRFYWPFMALMMVACVAMIAHVFNLPEDKPQASGFCECADESPEVQQEINNAVNQSKD